MVTETFIRPTVAELEKFYDYLDSFYGDGGIYDMGATYDQFVEATEIHLKILELQEKEFCGDSIDRELVRDILSSKFKFNLDLI